MPSIINSDDGVVSGTSGLKTTGGNDGVTTFQQNGTEAARITSGRNFAIGTNSPTSSYVARYLQIADATSAGVVFSGPRKFSLYTTSSSTFALIDDDASGVTRLSVNSSGNFSFNSGYGSAATAYGCRAWVNFNGTGTVAIRASGNVSTITDAGTGQYTVNFATAMPDTNYATVGSGYIASSGLPAFTDAVRAIVAYSNNSSSCRIQLYRTNTNSFDSDSIEMNVAVFR
jgi:hypothetical protein